MYGLARLKEPAVCRLAKTNAAIESVLLSCS